MTTQGRSQDELADLLRTVVESTFNATGDGFFRPLTRELATALGRRYCFVAECVDSPVTQVATLAFWNGETFLDNFAYDLAGTPCEAVFAGEEQLFTDGIQARFPYDRDLVDLAAEGYVAVPLRGVSGQVIGHLAMLDVDPLKADGPELPLLRIFAARAAAELERRRTETVLRQSELQYRQLFEESISGVYVATPAGRLVSCNPACARVFGFGSVEEALADSGWTLALASEDFRSVVERLCREGRLEGHERSYRRPDGEVLHAIENLVGRFDDAGRLVEVRGYLLDLTHLKHLEQRLFQAQKMESIGQLAGGIAHDFNNLLTAILGFGEMLLWRLPEDATARRDCQAILKAAQRGAELTGQLLAFSRKQVMQPRIIDLNGVVRGLERMLHKVTGENVEVLTSLDPELPPVYLDPNRIEQALFTLAINARDAMSDGGRLTIRTNTREIAGSQLPSADLGPGQYVALAVTDTGKGIDPELHDKIFEPFFTTKEQGTGLGLSSVYGIVKQSGGAVRVDSRPGQGATFTLLFPCAGCECADDELAAPAPKETLAGTETLLVAEDQPEIRKLVGEMLTARGYRVMTAGNAESALHAASRHDGPIHLLITDVVMPGPSGRELADRLCATRPETRVLFMSGHTDEVILRHGVREGSLAFLQKPFTEKALLVKVRQVLDPPRSGVAFEA